MRDPLTAYHERRARRIGKPKPPVKKRTRDDDPANGRLIE